MGLNAVDSLRSSDAIYYWANRLVPYLLHANARYRERWYGYAGITDEGLLMQWTLGPSSKSAPTWMHLQSDTRDLQSTQGAMMLLMGSWDHQPTSQDWDDAVARAGELDPERARVRDMWDFEDESA